MSSFRQIALGILVVAGAASPVQKPTEADLDAVRRISQPQFRELLAAGAVLAIDVRAAAVFDLGHIAGSINVPAAEIDVRAGDLIGRAGNRRIVTYCSCPAEHTAAEAAFVLGRRGAKNVSALAGGYVDWVMTGGKVDRRSGDAT